MACPNPCIDVLNAKFPEASRFMSWEVFPFDPLVDGVTADTQMGGYFVHLQPSIGHFAGLRYEMRIPLLDVANASCFSRR